MFVEVKEIEKGGTGVPIPFYRGTFKGETLKTFAKGQARAACDWVAGRTADFAIYANIDGTEHVVLRGTA